MKYIYRNRLRQHNLPGRILQYAVGKDSESVSMKMTMGFATYSSASGIMEPHQHAEEVVYVVRAHDVWIRTGPGKDKLGDSVRLEPSMVLHIPEMEWHVFEYGEGGFIDVIFFYGQIDNIRPEETN